MQQANRLCQACILPKLIRLSRTLSLPCKLRVCLMLSIRVEIRLIRMHLRPLSSAKHRISVPSFLWTKICKLLLHRSAPKCKACTTDRKTTDHLTSNSQLPRSCSDHRLHSYLNLPQQHQSGTLTSPKTMMRTLQTNSYLRCSKATAATTNHFRSVPTKLIRSHRRPTS